MAKAKSIPVDKCVIPDVRITAVYDEELEALLHDSIGAVGQIVPIVVVEAEGYYYVSDGKHRLEEARRRGESEISAVVRPGKPEDVLLLNLVTNRLRGKTKASEMVTVIEALYKDHQLGIDEIQERTGLSRDYIERLIVVSEASHDVREALDCELIGIGAAYEISRLPHPDQQAEVLNKYQIWRWPVKDLHDLVARVLKEMEGPTEPPGPPPPAPPVMELRCDICKRVHGRGDLRAVLLCPDCHSAAWKGQQEVRDNVLVDKQPTHTD